MNKIKNEFKTKYIFTEKSFSFRKLVNKSSEIN